MRAAVLPGAVFRGPAHRSHQRSFLHVLQLPGDYFRRHLPVLRPEVASSRVQGLELAFPETADFLHHRVSRRFQILPVHREQVAFPQMQGIPRGSGLVPFKSLAPVNVLGRPGRPARSGLAASRPELFLLPGDFTRGGRHFPDVIHQRVITFRQVGGEHSPVAHLDVDIIVVVGIPRRNQAVIPQALEVGGQIPRLGGGKDDVAAEVEHQFLQIGITGVPSGVHRLPVPLQPLVDGEFRRGVLRLSQVQGNAVVKLAVGAPVGGFQLLRSRLERTGQNGVIPLAGRLPLPVPGSVQHVIRSQGNQHAAGIRPPDGDGAAVSRDTSTPGKNGNARLIGQSVLQGTLHQNHSPAPSGRGRNPVLRMQGRQAEGGFHGTGPVPLHRHGNHLVRNAGEILPPVTDSPGVVGHGSQRLRHIQRPFIILHVLCCRIRDFQRAERLVGSEFDGIRPLVLGFRTAKTSGPHADFRQLQAVLFHASVNERSYSSVADRRGVLRPGVVPGSLLGPRLLPFRRTAEPDQGGFPCR